MITTDQVKELREKTGISVMQCKKALEEAGGDMAKAMEVLKTTGTHVKEKKSGRDLNSGVVQAYIHGDGDIGAIVELLCETDFVAKNEEFKQLAYDIAMHVAAMNPADKDTLVKSDFVKDPSHTIDDLIQTATQKFGERTEVGNFTRFSITGR
ncbi:elongation factor Ts [bacterium]|nr:elongation factor Ts [bacterium]|tara:strand:+ start:5347 stop:5805 length:459 start_codon:yes stop_codon:yes gene_type:complete